MKRVHLNVDHYSAVISVGIASNYIRGEKVIIVPMRCFLFDKYTQG